MKSAKKILVAGAGGFIGGHLVGKLLEDGHQVRAVDIKPQTEWYQRFPEANNLTLDLRNKEDSYTAVNGCDWVFNHAADMGGMGFIELNKGLCMLREHPPVDGSQRHRGESLLLRVICLRVRWI